MRSFEPTFEPNGVVDVRRVEVITGIGGRRSWSRDDKARIIAESFRAGANVSAVARDTVYGRSRSMLGVGWLVRGPWHCEPRRRSGLFRSPPRAEDRRRRARRCRDRNRRVVIRAAMGVDWRHLCDVVRAVKAAPWSRYRPVSGC